MQFKKWFMETMLSQSELDDNDYRGMHRAPDKISGSPLYDVTLNGTYPDDIYSINAYRYYQEGWPYDHETISTIQYYYNKPNANIKIYRAIPKILTPQERINALEIIKRYILKYGRIPKNIITNLNSSQYYEKASREIEELEKMTNVPAQKIQINPGDWVTINRKYAVQHGISNLNNEYKILTKTVKVKTLFTDGNSIHEWGYDAN